MDAVRITSGHTDSRRTIWDLVSDGNVGGGQSLFNLAWFDPVHPGAQIGGAKVGYGHYHEMMWETYLILSGTFIMSLLKIDTDNITHFTLEVKPGEAPWKIKISPRVVHRLTAVTEVRLLIASTGPQVKEDTFESELPDPDRNLTYNQKYILGS